MTLPDQFCWTRFGTEAGQSIDQILWRKEQERIANGGLFFWGIGNAVGPSLRELIRQNNHPEVLFSPIKSAARVQDASPEAVVAWTSGRTLHGRPFQMPERAIVTSRFSPASPRGAHYALVCSSSKPLSLTGSNPPIEFGELRNILTGRPIGASQVTSVVYRDGNMVKPSRSYDVAFRVQLVDPFLVRLENHVRLPSQLSAACNGGDWFEAVRALWDLVRNSDYDSQPSLPGIDISGERLVKYALDLSRGPISASRRG